MLYRLADEGRALSTRERGVRLLADLRARTAGDAPSDVVIDFEDVLHASYSFIDEFVGVLMQDIHTSHAVAPRLTNVSPSIQRVIDRSLRTRGLHDLAVA